MQGILAAVASCSYPLCPRLPPTLKSGGARAAPEYMALAPMAQCVSLQQCMLTLNGAVCRRLKASNANVDYM